MRVICKGKEENKTEFLLMASQSNIQNWSSEHENPNPVIMPLLLSWRVNFSKTPSLRNYESIDLLFPPQFNNQLNFIHKEAQKND